MFCPHRHPYVVSLLFLIDTPPTQIYTLSLHDALPISRDVRGRDTDRRSASRQESAPGPGSKSTPIHHRVVSENSIKLETQVFADRKSTPSELQSRVDLVCRLLLEKKKHNTQKPSARTE